MKSEVLKIEGMSCNHCVMSVKNHLSNLASVVVEEVTVGKARIQYDESKLDAKDIARAIDAAGFTLVR
jgi:copper chaperone